jgi:MFS family permease
MDIISDISATKECNGLSDGKQESVRSKGLLFLVLFGIASMGGGAGHIAIDAIVLPAQVTSFVPAGNEAGIFSLILAVAAVVSVLTNPVAGMLSDRTTSRWGRRRPWFIAGGVLSVASLLLLASASSLLAVILGVIVLRIALELTGMALLAIIPDQVPIRQRAIVSAFSVGLGTLLGGLLGQILVARLFTITSAAYTSIAVMIAITAALFLLVLRDAPVSRAHIPPFGVKDILTLLKPLTYRDFALAWVSRCLMFLGYTTVVAFMFYFLKDGIHYTRLFPGQTVARGVQTFFAINVGSIVIASLIGGILSDKLQRRKLFVIIASLIMMVGLLLYAFFPVWSMVLVGTAILGIGFGIFLSVDTALASQMLPTAADRGKDMGLFNAATFVPSMLSPIIAGITLGILHSYLALFVFLAVASALSAVLIIQIKSVR